MRYEVIYNIPGSHAVESGMATQKELSDFYIEKDIQSTTSTKLEGLQQLYKMFQSPWQNWMQYRIDSIEAKACAWEEQRKNHPRQAGKV